MKKFLFIYLLAFFYKSQAQSDSVMVKIKCESAYRDAIIQNGVIAFETYRTKVDTNICFKVDTSLLNRKFRIDFKPSFNQSLPHIIEPENFSLNIIRNKTDYQVSYIPECENIKYLSSKVCPKCESSHQIYPIVYGLPYEGPNDAITSEGKLLNINGKRFYNPGCVVPHCPNHWYCSLCNFEF